MKAEDFLEDNFLKQLKNGKEGHFNHCTFISAVGDLAPGITTFYDNTIAAFFH